MLAFCFGFWGPLAVVAAEPLQVLPSHAAGTYATPFLLELKTNAPTARVFWSRSADATLAQVALYEGPIAISRTGSVYFFAFTPEPDFQDTPVQKAFFFVESQSGFEHFRLHRAEASGRIILKNYSRFALDTAGWQLEIDGEVFALKAGTLEPEVTISVDLPPLDADQEILLRAPDGNAKQLAVIPPLSADQVWQCETRRSTSCAVGSR